MKSNLVIVRKIMSLLLICIMVVGVFPMKVNATLDTVINIAAIEGVIPPTKALIEGSVLATTITETAQYTGTVSWSTNYVNAYKRYRAVITLTPKTGYILNGVTQNFFTVSGTVVNATNSANSGVIEAYFQVPTTRFDFDTPASNIITAGILTSTSDSTRIKIEGKKYPITLGNYVSNYYVSIGTVDQESVTISLLDDKVFGIWQVGLNNVGADAQSISVKSYFDDTYVSLYSTYKYSNDASFSAFMPINMVGVANKLVITSSVSLKDVQIDYVDLSTVMDRSETSSITSATFNVNTNVLSVTGVNLTSGAAIDATKFTITGEGGATYTLTATNGILTSSTTEFSITLNNTDQREVKRIFNKNGSSSISTTNYNLSAQPGWHIGGGVDLTNPIMVSNVAVPTITSVSLNTSTGVLSVTGTGFLIKEGATNDIIANKFTFTGEDSVTYTLTDTANVEINNNSTTSFQMTLSTTDKVGVNALLNKSGLLSSNGIAYNLSAAEDWAAGADATVDVSDTTSPVTVVVPAITNSTYNANTGVLVVNGSNYLATVGLTNDIIANKFTMKGEGGATYTLTDTENVEISSASAFTLSLSATDKAAVNMILNKNGSSSTGVTTYNLAAAEDWNAGATVNLITVDSTNPITVSLVAIPTITSAIYNMGTGEIEVTGTGFLSASGVNNDIIANKLTLKGQAGATYTLTNTNNVDISSNTSFSISLSATDKTEVDLLINKEGSSSMDGITYNLAAAEDWAAGANATLNVADLTGNGISAINGTPTFAVTFNGNSNTSGTIPSAQSKVEDVSLSLASNTGNLVRTNYTFVGWNTASDGSGTNYAVGAQYTANVAVVLYAKWQFNYAAGDGSAGNPYQISDWNHLNNVRLNLTAHYVLKNNLNENSSGYANLASTTANAGAGWSPIGTVTTPFEGFFDGKGYTIDDLYINRPDQDAVGLFGQIGNWAPVPSTAFSVKNLGLNNAQISGRWYVGGITGKALYSDFENVYANNINIIAIGSAGGLVGVFENWSTFTQNIKMQYAYSSGKVTAKSMAGGLIGSAGTYQEEGYPFESKLSLLNCYSTADVTTEDGQWPYAGGLIADVNGIVILENVYATGKVLGHSKSTGGLVGLVWDEVSKLSIINGFWDIETTGQITSASDKGSGKTTSDMKKISTFTNWDIEETTSSYIGSPYPGLRNTSEGKVWQISKIIVPTIQDVTTPVKVLTPITIIKETKQSTETNNELNGPSVIIEQVENDVSFKVVGLETAIEFTEEERVQGAFVKLVLSVLERIDVPTEDKTLIDNFTKNVLSFDKIELFVMDISLFKIVGETSTAIRNTLEDLTISFILPEVFRDGTFKVIRVHDNEVEVLDHTYDESTFIVTFKSNKFSTYSIVAEHNDETPIPATSNLRNIFIWLLSLVGIVLLIFGVRLAMEKRVE